ncbi:hypothetical protein PHK61_20100 [Actinomycetospora lutea]|uniref:hypothetical protein n=1 Tax=Actinomycetospora lutea TaxID=663604 RepID=UPI002365AF6A|nr:hypothetical protein [Actinomycetospora lutea]MDD7940731.1 hypothetical protein [Actinomycetospora lutea]
MTRVHIRTDDEVYRVDAVWLGPPRATFPWRARYSAYGVGLVVMLVVMFVQRRLGIDLGFFSVAWALLITVAVTRFVSRRINDERPLLEWLTLFVHELRGPRERHRVTGGALTTGHVTVRRDRPKLTGAPTAIALPRGSSGTAGAGGRPARPVAVDPADDAAWGPPPREDEAPVVPVTPGHAAPETSAETAAETPAATPAEEPADTPAAEPADHVTPGVPKAGPSHARAARRTGVPSEATVARRRARAERRARAAAEADFGPPASADVGEPVSRPGADEAADGPAALPPVPDPHPGDATMAAWTGARSARREAVPARRRDSAVRKAVPDPDPDPDRTQRRAVRPRRRAGWPMSNEPAGPSGAGGTGGAAAPFGPGSRSREADRRGDPGAAPR